MEYMELFGYLAGLFLISMAAMKTQIAMRLCNMAGNLCFVIYGIAFGLTPVIVMNSIILALHAWRLARLTRTAAA